MPWAFDDFLFDDGTLELFRQGRAVKVDAQALRLLRVLLTHHHELVSKETLMTEVWEGRQLGDNVISVCVAKLRKALGPDASRAIVNAYGRGYRLTSAVRELPADELLAVRRPGASSTPPRPDADSALVGREATRLRLSRALSAAHVGKGASCALLGEPGIGKTRLAAALAEEARALGMGVAWGRSYDADETAALAPWVQIARAVDGPEPPAWTASGSEAASGAWTRTLEWLGELCRNACAARPWLLVFDDAQWADTASLTLLARLQRDLAELPLLVVLTVRDTERDTYERLRDVLGHRDCERMKLARLSEAEVASYVARSTDGEGAELTRAVYEKSEGNPFFMVELVRAFLDDPALLPSGALAVRGPALEVVREALRRLGAPALAALAAAAVIGRTFELGVLALALGRAPGELLDQLEHALAAQLIVAAPESGTAFSFAHDLIRSALYEDLARRERASLHLRVARALTREGTPASDPSSTAELARHLLHALPEGDASDAIAAARRAALSAQRVGAHADACALLRRALGALPLLGTPAPNTHAQLVLELARAERAHGNREFIAHLAQAVHIARKHRVGSVLADAGEMMIGGPGTVPMPGVTATLEAAQAALAPEDHAQRARVLAFLSISVPYCRDATEAQALLADASTLAREHPAARAIVLRQRIYYASGPDNEPEASALTRELMQLVVDLPLEYRAVTVTAQFDRLLRTMQRNDLTDAQQQLAVWGHAAQRMRHVELVWHHARIETLMRVNQGHFAHARERFAELYEQADAIGLFARTELHAIDSVELERQVTLDLARVLPDGTSLLPRAEDPPSVSALKLRTHVHRGEPEPAREGLRAIQPASLRALPRSRDYLATLASLAYVTTSVGERAHAEVLYELLAPYPSYSAVALSFHHLGVVALHLGRIAHFLGQHERAVTHLEAALATHERLGLLPLVANTRLALARALAALGGSDARARQQRSLHEARALSLELGMTPLVAAIDAEL